MEIDLNDKYIKAKAKKGDLVKFNYDEVVVKKNRDCYYRKKKTTIDGRPNGYDSFNNNELVDKERAVRLARKSLNSKLQEVNNEKN